MGDDYNGNCIKDNKHHNKLLLLMVRGAQNENNKNLIKSLKSVAECSKHGHFE